MSPITDKMIKFSDLQVNAIFQFVKDAQTHINRFGPTFYDTIFIKQSELLAMSLTGHIIKVEDRAVDTYLMNLYK